MNNCILQKVARRLVAAIALLMLLTNVSQSIAAPQVFGGIGGDEKEMMQQQFREALKNHKIAEENRIASRIADIDQACDLSDDQKTKLNIASKGAIKASMVQATKQMVETSKQMGFEFDPDAEPKEEKTDEDEDNPNQMAMQFTIPMFGGMGTGNPNDVEDHKVWKAAIKKVLSAEQAEKWTSWQKERLAFQQQSAVNAFIAKVDRKLLLSPEQREKLTEIVDTEHGEALAKQASERDNNQFGMNAFFAQAMAAQLGTDDEEKEADPIEAILNESQYEEWSKTFAPGLGQTMEGVIGGAFAAPALIGGIEIESDIEEPEEESDDDK